MHFRDIFFFRSTGFFKLQQNATQSPKTLQNTTISRTLVNEKMRKPRFRNRLYAYKKNEKTDSNFSHTRYNAKPAIKMRSNCFSEWCKYIPPLSIYMLAHLLKFVKSFFEFLFKFSINIETLSRVAEYLSWHPEVLHRCYIIIYYEKTRRSIEKRGDLW